MLSSEQEMWLERLSDEERVVIVSFDPTSQTRFEQIKTRIQSVLGSDFEVVHRGSSALGISGQDEIDVCVLVSPELFDEILLVLEKALGKPRSVYPKDRARFSVELEGKKIDLFLTNKEHDGWLNSVKFENYLRTHPEVLQAYRLLKENLNGATMREYYRQKIEFINDILNKTLI